MKKFASLFVLLVLATAAFAQTAAAPAPAAAAVPAGPAKIGIINVQQAIVATNEGQRDLKALQTKFEPIQTDLQNGNKEVTDLQNQLKTQGDKLNQDALGNLQKQIDTKQKALQRKFEDAQADFQGQQNDIVNRIGGKLMQTLENYAKSNGFTLILDVSGPQNPVLWANNAADVTVQIVEQYNASSGVPAPATAAATPAKPAGGTPRATTPASTTKKP
jgi:Skp family chaperone for outer membrane proteins